MFLPHFGIEDMGLDIAIIGGGVAGLSLLCYLQLTLPHLKVQVFEKDEEFNNRGQGYSLTIQQGKTLLRKLQIETQCREKSGVISVGYDRINASDGDKILQRGAKQSKKITEKNKKFSNFPIARQELREIVLQKIINSENEELNLIQWGHALDRFEVSEDELLQVFFKNGKEIKTKSIIGCDGLRSVVRNIILNDPLVYSGKLMINGITETTNKRFFHRVFEVVDGTNRVFIKPFSMAANSNTQKTMWQLTFDEDEEVAKRLATNSDVEKLSILLEIAKERTKDYLEPVRDLIHSTAVNTMRGGPLYDRDPIPIECVDNWHLPVTLLGDAAHPMTPFKGQGANTAMTDILEMVDCLQKGLQEGKSYSQIFREYEKKMIPRATLKQQASRQITMDTHTDSALSKE